MISIIISIKGEGGGTIHKTRARVQITRPVPVVIMNKWSVVDYGGHNVSLNILTLPVNKHLNKEQLRIIIIAA